MKLIPNGQFITGKPFVVMYCDHCNRQKRDHEPSTLACPVGKRSGNKYESFHPQNRYKSERKKDNVKFRRR